MSLIIERVPTGDLDQATRDAILTLCRNAYGENLARYVETIGPGVHLLGRDEADLVAHVMWVDRRLDPGNLPPLKTAYVELLGTDPSHQRRGYATELMDRLADEIAQYEIGALSPTDPAFYERLGWENWRGPLLVSGPEGITAVPDETAMVLRLPGTPSDLDLSASLAVSWRPGEIW